MITTMLTLLLTSQVASPAPLLDRMQATTGDDYVAARAALVELSWQAVPYLTDRIDRTRWTDETWEADAIAVIAHAHLTSPKRVAQVHELRGANPAFYEMRRRPVPEVGRDLTRLDAGPLLIELITKLDHDLVVRIGATQALGRSKHPVAGPALRSIAATDPAVEVRMQAVYGLGLVGDEASLVRHLKTAELKASALSGLGHIRSTSSLGHLVEALDTEHRKAAAAAIGVLASRRMLRRHDVVNATTLHQTASRALMQALETHPSDEATLTALAQVGSAELLPQLSAKHPAAARRLERSLSRSR